MTLLGHTYEKEKSRHKKISCLDKNYIYILPTTTRRKKKEEMKGFFYQSKKELKKKKRKRTIFMFMSMYDW
jgi:hypothetical protein